MIIDYLWQFLYNKYSVNGVLIVSRKNFEEVMQKLSESLKEQEINDAK